MNRWKPRRPVFVPFVFTSLGLTLTLGATAGMVNLLRIAAGGDVPVSHRQIHGHTQIFGFAAIFLMGVAYFALPRLLAVEITPRFARASLWLVASGVVLRNAGQPLAFFSAGRLLCLLSAGAEVGGGLLFAAFVFSALARGQRGKYDRSDPLFRFVFAGNLYFLLVLLFDAAEGVALAGHPEPALPFALADTLDFAALYGFLLAWIFGVASRMLVLFLGIGSPKRGALRAALALQAGGVVLYAVALLPGLPDRAVFALKDAGLAGVSTSALLYLAGCGFLWRRKRSPSLPVPGAPPAVVRAAWGALALWALLSLASIAVARLTRFPAQNPWYRDAARHLFAVGFLTLLIVAVATRILPFFANRTLWSPRLALATNVLLVAGVGMRLLEYPGAFDPRFYQAGSFSGVAVVAALALFAVNMGKTLGSRPLGLPVAE